MQQPAQNDLNHTDLDLNLQGRLASTQFRQTGASTAAIRGLSYAIVN